MLDKKFLERAVFVFAFVAVTMVLENCVYAQKEPKGPDLPEIQAYNPPVCPTCKSRHATHIKGKVTAPIICNTFC